MSYASTTETPPVLAVSSMARNPGRVTLPAALVSLSLKSAATRHPSVAGDSAATLALSIDGGTLTRSV